MRRFSCTSGLGGTFVAGVAVASCALAGRIAGAELSEAARWAAAIGDDYVVVAEIDYLGQGDARTRLDAYVPLRVTGPPPTVVYFHGGGWNSRTKATSNLDLLPFLELNLAVVNADYRIAPEAPAPAAIEDCRCALRWAIRNATDYNFDTARIVLCGRSAGGHLALITGMLPDSTALDRRCPGGESMAVAAIVSWSGITDVGQLLGGPEWRDFAHAWVGGIPDSAEVARSLSPVNHVRPGLPPILSLHGDADPVVPYSQAVRLHEALDRARVANRLVTLPGAGHAGLGAAEMVRGHEAIREFLAEHGVIR